MPRSKTVLKRQRQNERSRLRNKAARSALKTRERRVRTGAGDANTEARALQSELDRSAARGAIHPNKAARKKSRLAKAANKSS
jgi:small subunit ribosomal protein S20